MLGDDLMQGSDRSRRLRFDACKGNRLSFFLVRLNFLTLVFLAVLFEHFEFPTFIYHWQSCCFLMTLADRRIIAKLWRLLDFGMVASVGCPTLVEPAPGHVA